MPGKNINQIDPTTTLQSTDKFYLGRSPFSPTDDHAITWQNILAAINATAQLASALQITNLYGGGVQTPSTGAATAYTLTYPFANVYVWTPDAGVGLIVTLPAYDATKMELAQPLIFINNGGTNSAVQLYDKDANFITNTSIGPSQWFISWLGVNTATAEKLGTIAKYNIEDFIAISARGAANGVASLDPGAHLPATQFPALTGDVTTTAGSVATTIDQSKLFSSYVASLSANLDLRNTTNFPICPTYIDITFDSSLRDIIMPATNASNAAKSGKLIVIKNSSGAGNNRILAQDGTTTLFTITAGTNIVIELTGTGTANGTWAQVLGISDVLGTMAYQNANSVAITGGSATTMTSLEVSTSNSGAINEVRSNNSSNTANSSAMFEAVVAGASGGDAYTKYTVASVTDWTSGVDNSDSDAYVLAASDALGTTNIMRAAKGGTVTFPKTPAFLGYNDTFRSNVTGDNTIYTVPFNQEIFDQSFSYDTSTYTFTAADTGRVLLGCTLLISNIGAHTGGIVRLVTSNRPYELWAANPSGAKDGSGNIIVNVSQLADMDVGDTATIQVSVSGSTKTIAIGSTLYDTTFFGFVAC